MDHCDGASKVAAKRNHGRGQLFGLSIYLVLTPSPIWKLQAEINDCLHAFDNNIVPQWILHASTISLSVWHSLFTLLLDAQSVCRPHPCKETRAQSSGDPTVSGIPRSKAPLSRQGH